MSEPQMLITITEDGPYVVSGGIPLQGQTIGTNAAGEAVEWRAGEVRATPEPYYQLCRCGQSRNKPFCDESHRRVGFDGTETASYAPHASNARAYPGPEMMLSDNVPLCALARFCHPNGEVWNLVAHDDAQSKGHLIEQVGECPSGRLVLHERASGAQIEPDYPPSIGLVQDPAAGCSGPLWVRGGVTIVSSEGRAYEVRNRVTLCRCGGSSNKPFCDGTHARIGFRDDR